jgi:hypothetical protein
MVDFTKLMTGTNADIPVSLVDTFKSLDRKTTHVDLRPVQEETLRALDRRLDARDTVLRVSTGGGKTVMGLLYLYHLMRRDRLPTVYLVPTVQLIEQVLTEAGKIGVSACPYLAGETHPPVEATRCDSVLVCSYEKFFNGLTTFLRSDVALMPGAIVLDDVHAGIESVRRCYSARLSSEAFGEVRDLLGAELAKQSPGPWKGIELGDPSANIEVPFWIWKARSPDVRVILSKYVSSTDLKFAWPLLADQLELCRCVFSGSGCEIALDPPPLDRQRHYAQSKHRLFMSASINDGSSLVRELGCDPAALSDQVGPSFDGGPGERLIITTSLVDPQLNTDEIAKTCLSLASVTNVVVLVPSEKASRRWVAAGARYVHGEQVSVAVDRLRNMSRGNFYVFAQRYDGIDLPDDACRLLVIDGIPRGDSLIDQIDQQQHGHQTGIRNKTANRLEQGLGRAVRSPADYCAVLLVGGGLAQFVSQHSTLDLLNAATVQQLSMSRMVSEAAQLAGDPIKAIADTIMQSLRRDRSWRQFYAQEMAKVSSKEASSASYLVVVGDAERKAMRHAIARNYSAARDEVQQVTNKVQLDDDSKAALLERLASYVFHLDEQMAHEIQRKAYMLSSYVNRPVETAGGRTPAFVNQVSRFTRWMSQFSHPNGALTELHSLRTQLAYTSTAESVENGLERLGTILGAEATRPERETGRGPDVLWRFDKIAFAIEAKNERKKTLPKGDAAQLLLSTEWCRSEYPAYDDIVSVIASDSTKADRKDDFNFGARVLTGHLVQRLIDALIKSASVLIVEGRMFADPPDIVSKHIHAAKLSAEQIKASLLKIE